MKENLLLHVSISPQEVSSAYLLRKSICIVRLRENGPFSVLHTANIFWKMKDLKFDSESAYIISKFTFELVSTDITSIEVTEDMIENVCMAIPHDSTYVILDMEWKELDSNLKLVYVYK